MQRLLTRLLAASAVCAACTVLSAGPTSAHENRPVGPLQFAVGWGDEPTFTGYRNSVTLRISRGGQPVAGVTGIEARVETGDQTVDLTLHQAFGEPGLYEAPLIPTRPGTYTFSFTGTAAGEEFTETFTSGESTFDSPKDATEIAFPAKDPSPGQLAQRVDRESARVKVLQAAANDAEDDISQTKVVAYAGIALAVLALAAGRLGQSRRR